MQIKFPGVSCCECGRDLPPGSEAVVHPNKRGPKGGKRYAHPNCGGWARANAGRRTSRGEQKSGRKARMAAPVGPEVGTAAPWHVTDLRSLSRQQLLDLGLTEELARRARDAEGKKLAWKTKKNPVYVTPRGTAQHVGEDVYAVHRAAGSIPRAIEREAVIERFSEVDLPAGYSIVPEQEGRQVKYHVYKDGRPTGKFGLDPRKAAEIASRHASGQKRAPRFAKLNPWW